MWIILCGACGTLIGHFCSTIYRYNNNDCGPVPELCAAIGFLVGAILGVTVDFVTRRRGFRHGSRALWILLLIAVLTYVLLLPAFQAARE